MIRVWSFRRLPGLNCAKAMRDMRSPPKTAWGLRLETDASCSPDSSSISVVTTLVVPMSIARPNFIPAVSPRSTARIRCRPPAPPRTNVATVTPAGAAPRAEGLTAEWPLAHDGGGRGRPRQELARARGAPPAPATRRGDVDTACVRRLENRRPGRNAERPARRDVDGIVEDCQRDGHGPSF